jgi:hypothetical protein
VTRRHRRPTSGSRIDHSRSRWWAPVVVVAAALVVKITVLAQLGDHPLLQPQGELDSALYVRLARSIATAGPFGDGEPFHVSPLYAYFLAAIPLCCSAAAALTLASDSIRARQWKTLATGLVMVAAIGLLAAWPLGISAGTELEQGRRVVWLIEQGRIAEAREHAARVERSHARPGLVHY